MPELLTQNQLWEIYKTQSTGHIQTPEIPTADLMPSPDTKPEKTPENDLPGMLKLLRLRIKNARKNPESDIKIKKLRSDALEIGNTILDNPHLLSIYSRECVLALDLGFEGGILQRNEKGKLLHPHIIYALQTSLAGFPSADNAAILTLRQISHQRHT